MSAEIWSRSKTAERRSLEGVSRTRTGSVRLTLLDLESLLVRVGGRSHTRIRTCSCRTHLTRPRAVVVVVVVLIVVAQQSSLGDIVGVGDQCDCGVVIANMGDDDGFWTIGVDDPAVYELYAGLCKEVEFACVGGGGEGGDGGELRVEVEAL